MSSVRFESHKDEVLTALNDRIPIILEALGLKAEGNAVDEANKLIYDQPESPNYIRTGRLKNSISHWDDGKTAAYVGTNLKYAPYVELGTKRMKARPFLRNSVTEYADDYKRIIEDGLK